MKKSTDIDIDFADRSKALTLFKHIPASSLSDNDIIHHNVGVHFQNIPVDPVSNRASIPYKDAVERGYFKMDLLNVHVYEKVKSNDHLEKLLKQEPIWEFLESETIVADLFQIHNHFETVNSMKPKSIEQLAMVLAIIRPGKKHLVGKPWDEIEQEVWQKSSDDKYQFKKSHALSYSMVIVMQLNLLLEEINQRLDDEQVVSDDV